jgi:Kef-type K+ transport system membrane component KefB
MTFGTLSVIVLAGLAGPLVSASGKVIVPVIVGELAAGLVVGRTGFGWIHPADPTTAFLAAIGFAMLMFTAGMHVPVRQPELVRRLGRGATAAGAAGVFAIGAGIATARIAGVPHPAIYVVILASGSAAVLVPSLHEAGLLNQSEGLVVAAQIAVADVLAIIAVPLVLRPNRATHALLGALAVAACAVLLYFALRSLRGAAWIGRIRMLSKKREWALDLRVSLLVLFGLAWLATRTGTSVLVAGFAVGLVVAAIGGPKRLSRQVVGVAQGFFVPLFFVVLGAQIDLRAFGTHGSLVVLAALLIVFNVLLSVGAAAVTKQSVGAGLAAAVSLGVPAAVVTLGLQQHVISAGIGAAIMVAALASIGVSAAGVAMLHRQLAPPVTPSGAGASPPPAPGRARSSPA